jgi:hypothetical protein
MSRTKIIKYDFYGEQELAHFDIGDEVDLEEYPPEPIEDKTVDHKILIWPGTRRAIIVDTSDYDGDVDDETGRSIGIPAKAWVAIVPRGWREEPFIEQFDINELFLKGELYGSQ